jgi:GDSL-like Lipase/Acylhydrolase family/Pectate lyase superfamily protein
MKRVLPFAALLCFAAAAPAQTPSQYVLFTSSNIADMAGNKLASGTFTATPVLAPNSTVPAAPHLAGGGRGVPLPVVFNVTDGALSPAYGTGQLLDVTQANPANFCYATTVHDNNSGDTWKLDSCLQPAYNATGCTVSGGQTTCDYDNMVPTGTPGALEVAGPPGLIPTGAWSSSTTYQIDDVATYNGAAYVNLLAGNTNTPPGTGWSLLVAQGSTAITGLSGDGAGDAALSGNFNVGGTVAAGAGLLGALNGTPQLSSSGLDSTGATDDSAALNAAITALTSTAAGGNTLTLPPGSYYVPGLSNPYGVQFLGSGSLLTSISQTSTNLASATVTASKGQINSYAYKNRFMFGQEYLSHWLASIYATANGTFTPIKVVFSGDSTTAGVNVVPPYTVDQMFLNAARRHGITGVTVVNSGHSGDRSVDWLSSGAMSGGYFTAGFLYADQLLNPDVYVIRWGINDPIFGGNPTTLAAALVSNIRTGLAQIRANKTVDQETIVLETPSAVNDNPNGRDRIYEEQVRDGLAKAARDYQAVFIDLYGLMQDQDFAVQTCMMDLPYASSGTSTPPIHIHPGVCKNPIYESYLEDALMPSGTAMFSDNLFENISGNDVSTTPMSTPPNGFGPGNSWIRAEAANGWPLEGWAETHVFADGGLAIQYDFPLTVSGPTAAYWWRVGSGTTWGAWVSVNAGAWSQTTPTPSCGSGTATTLTATVRVNTIGKHADVNANVIDTTNGTCASYISVPLPFAVEANSMISCYAYVSPNLVAATAAVNAGGSALIINKYDGTTLAATGNSITCNGVVETQ